MVDRDAIVAERKACLAQSEKLLLHVGLAMSYILRAEGPSEGLWDLGAKIAFVFQDMETIRFWLKTPLPDDIRVLAGSFSPAHNAAKDCKKGLRMVIRQCELLSNFPIEAVRELKSAKAYIQPIEITLDALIAMMTVTDSDPDLEPATATDSDNTLLMTLPPLPKDHKVPKVVGTVGIDWTVVKLVGSVFIIAICAFALGALLFRRIR